MQNKKKVENLINARKRKIIRRRFITALRLIGILAFFAAAVWGLNYFYNSNYFKIKELEVEGLKYYSLDEIEAKTGNLVGCNIFEVDKKKIEDLLKDEMIWISQADLHKVFPDKIVVEVTERKPYLKVNFKGDVFLLDSEGVVLEKIQGEDMDLYQDLILVANALDYSIGPGEKIAKKNLLSCAVIYTAMEQEIKKEIKEAGLEDDREGSIFFITLKNQKIIFGNSKDIIKKVQVLKELLKEKTNYNIIDLRSTDNPVVK